MSSGWLVALLLDAIAFMSIRVISVGCQFLICDAINSLHGCYNNQDGYGGMGISLSVADDITARAALRKRELYFRSN